MPCLVSFNPWQVQNACDWARFGVVSSLNDPGTPVNSVQTWVPSQVKVSLCRQVGYFLILLERDSITCLNNDRNSKQDISYLQLGASDFSVTCLDFVDPANLLKIYG